MVSLPKANKAAELTNNRLKEMEEERKRLLIKKEVDKRIEIIKSIEKAIDAGQTSCWVSYDEHESMSAKMRKELTGIGYALEFSVNQGAYASSQGYPIGRAYTLEYVKISWGEENV